MTQKFSFLPLLCAFMLCLSACASPPKAALSGADEALKNAALKKDCAPEKFAAAQKLRAEAQALVEQEKYDEAERKANAAKALALEAQADAEANWEECQRQRQVVTEATRPAGEGDGQQSDPGAQGPAAVLTTLYFPYDSAEVLPEQRERLEQNAMWMRQNPEKSLVLEGHTDERGSSEYNVALGERRAVSVKTYMEQLGIEASRLQILSYGEEKPVAYGQDEADYRSNRRVEFIPQGK